MLSLGSSPFEAGLSEFAISLFHVQVGEGFIQDIIDLEEHFLAECTLYYRSEVALLRETIKIMDEGDDEESGANPNSNPPER